jgi:hypothetical protein
MMKKESVAVNETMAKEAVVVKEATITTKSTPPFWVP